LVAMESAEQVRTPSPAPLTPIQVSAVGIDTPRGPQGTGLFGDSPKSTGRSASEGEGKGAGVEERAR
jgi:hypothetical protein